EGDRPARRQGGARSAGEVRRARWKTTPHAVRARGCDRRTGATGSNGGKSVARALRAGQGTDGEARRGGVAPMTTRTAKTTDAVLAQTITREVAKRVVGQEVMVERLLIGLLTGGHILLEGVPGLAKTLAVRTVAECLRISFSRIQFTPDLLPADVIGTMVFDQRSQGFYPKKGPLFANLVLADE